MSSPLVLIQKDLFDEETFVPIQALSWKAPFGQMMLHGKVNETRRWPTLYRGRVLICLTKDSYIKQELLEMCTPKQVKALLDMMEHEPLSHLNGHAIAVGQLMNCRPMRKTDESGAFVKYDSGLYVHEYQEVQRIIPFPFKGGQKWKAVNKQEKLAMIQPMTGDYTLPEVKTKKRKEKVAA